VCVCGGGGCVCVCVCTSKDMVQGPSKHSEKVRKQCYYKMRDNVPLDCVRQKRDKETYIVYTYEKRPRSTYFVCTHTHTRVHIRMHIAHPQAHMHTYKSKETHVHTYTHIHTHQLALTHMHWEESTNITNLTQWCPVRICVCMKMNINTYNSHTHANTCRCMIYICTLWHAQTQTRSHVYTDNYIFIMCIPTCIRVHTYRSCAWHGEGVYV